MISLRTLARAVMALSVSFAASTAYAQSGARPAGTLAQAAAPPALAPAVAEVPAPNPAVPAVAQPPAATQTQPPAPAAFTAGWQDGFLLQSATGDYRLLVGMVGQMDGRFSVDDPTPIINTFTTRKLRPTFSGRIARYFDFKFMPDFGNGTAVVQDAYFDVRFSPALRVRTGKDKTPVGYELLVGDAFLLFPERSLASSLVPNRDIGVQVQGDLARGKLFYAGGVFNGVPDGSSATTEVDTNNGKDLAGRIVVQPFRSTAASPGALAGLGFQIGGSVGQQSGALPAFRTSVGQTYFSYAVTTADGDRSRVSPAIFYYYKAFGTFAEYMRSTQDVVKNGTGQRVTNDAWNLTGSYVLTGENGADRGVRPRNNFDPPAGRWGALQLVARYAELHIDDAVFTAGLAAAGASRGAQSFTVGANWYPAAFIKYYATFERTVFDGDADGTRPAENVILFRAQVAF
jgi:phosphate-selective porin OprO/OprP